MKKTINFVFALTAACALVMTPMMSSAADCGCGKKSKTNNSKNVNKKAAEEKAPASEQSTTE